MTNATIPDTERAAWTLFRVRPVRAAQLTPHLARVTFGATGGDPLAHFADNGYDQRIKLILPPPGGDLSSLPDGGDWYRRLRDLPDETRPIVRTYTVRAVRRGAPTGSEVDIDMVLHGTAGPASAWAAQVLAHGDEVGRRSFEAALLGPDARFRGWHGGREFVTDVTGDLLIVGDETALPAIAGILELLPEDAEGTVLIEVPGDDDALGLAGPRGMRIRWLPRNGGANGERMTEAALAWRPARPAASGGAEAADPADWDEVAWEVPARDSDRGIRAWVAGEAAAVREIRRHLVGACALAREDVAFMGYWRLGRAEN